MGLLDDAIREHLELKRRRGADPGEVAREQHEALDLLTHDAPADRGPDEPFDEAPPTEAPESSGAPAITGAAPDEIDADLADGARTGAAQADSPAMPAGVDETAEIDMRAVLGEDQAPAAPAGPAAPAAPGVAGGVRPAPVDDDSLEWEMPGDEVEQALASEDAEDVLEETPDFLRDTPEQERLWFEQRPPRDFDFDK